MKLEHYPEFQKGKEAHVNFDESQLDDGVGNHCLVGHFLNGKCPYRFSVQLQEQFGKIMGDSLSNNWVLASCLNLMMKIPKLKY